MARAFDYTPFPTVAQFINSQKFYNVCCSNRGGGKCLQIGTPVLMYDGSVRPVETITRGDLVMGDDSTPREVQGVVSGRTQLYEIVPGKGDPFAVTWNHILSFKKVPSQGGGVVDIDLPTVQSLCWAFDHDCQFWNRHHLFRTGVDFPYHPPRVDPYFFGVWLGDGTKEALNVTTQDQVIVDAVYQVAAQWHLEVRIQSIPGNNASTYCLTATNGGLRDGRGHVINLLHAAMRDYGLLAFRLKAQSKYIPDDFKLNSREVRLALLAGIIDTDGHLSHSSYEITQKNEQLCDDIIFVARSLGFAAYKAKCQKSSQYGTVGTYYRTIITGDCSQIPVRIPYKKALPRRQRKDQCSTSIRAINDVGYGDYAGFELSGNGRFLLGDFTVTHNSTAGFIRAIVRAQMTAVDYYPLKWAVIRDTRKNLGKTTAVTMRKWWPSVDAKWVGKPEEPESCTLFVTHQGKKLALVVFDFFGVNSDADHDRFQSYEASGGVWIEEPCPARTNTEFISSGVSESVLAMAVTSLRGAPLPSVQLTMNPPSADHWTAQLWHLPGYAALGDEEAEMPEQQRKDRDAIRADSAVFMIPPRENAAERETPGYTEHNRQILSATGNTAMLARLVEGRVGYVQVGERVTPDFHAQHLAPGLQIIPQVPLALFFDYGLNPTCLVTQIAPSGHWLIHKAWSRENIGMKQLLELYVQPWIVQQQVRQWWYGGGPEAMEPDQSNSEMSALKTILSILGNGIYRRGPVSWSARRDAMHDALSRFPGGLPWIRINPDGAALLVRALDGGWAYATDPLGRVRRDQPDKKNRFDHLGDAFAHGCAILTRRTDAQSRSVADRPGVQTVYRKGSHRGTPTRTGV